MMMMVVGGWVGGGGWVVCMELWPLAMQNATDMATLCCWARVRLFWHPGQATTWHPAVCQVATGNSTWLCPVVVHQPMKQLARPPMPSCHQGTTHTGCAGLPSLFWATSGLGHHARLPPGHHTNWVCWLAQFVFCNRMPLKTLKAASSFS